MAAAAFSIPATVIGFDDAIAKLGALSLQDALEVLSARVAKLEAANAALETQIEGFQFDQAVNSGLFPGL